MNRSAIGRDEAPGILDGYRFLARSSARSAVHSDGDSPVLDELLAGDGDVRPDSVALAATVDLLGAEGVRARSAQAARLLENDGVTYGSDPQLWRLDPLPVIVGAGEWSALAAGLAQRARLMDRLLTDLYGDRSVIATGLVPPEVVFGHAEFLRQCDGIRLRAAHQLTLSATDVVRDRDGWVAMGERTQAPSGAGYAMANRRIVSRVMPGLYRDTLLQRLRSFFTMIRQALQAVSPMTGEAPSVVILTPGPESETSYDQAFLSALLGFPLVVGQDLTVRDGRLWMRSLGRPQPVDVVVRRVDSWFCDPLELRPDSRLGVPGLLEAARLGNVSIVNPPGSGVLENPGLVPFLPAIAAALLGEELTLPTVTTWWCGDPVQRSHVLSHLSSLVTRPIARGIGRANRFGWELSAVELAQLRARIEAEPHAWCAQEPLQMSTAPVIAPGGLEPRRLVLRGFAVAQEDGYHVMAGALGRVGAEPDNLDVSSQAGALAKDVWVIAGREVLETTAPESESDLSASVLSPVTGLSARAAEDMFWLGRYAERAEDAARLLRVAADLAADHAQRSWSAGSIGATSLHIFLRALTGVTTTFPGFIGDGASGRMERPFGELLRITADPYAPGTLAHAVRHTVEAAYAVREVLSPDIWLVLGSLDRVLLELGQRSGESDVHLQPTLSRVLEGLLAMSGLVAEGMVRDAGWYLMDAGRRIERALQLVALLQYTLTEPHTGPVDDLVLESVLICAESVITYRRRYPGRPRIDDVLTLLLLDRDNPRGVLHQLDRLAEDLTQLPRLSAPGPRQVLHSLQHQLRDAADSSPGALAAGLELSRLLDGLSHGLADLAGVIAQTHFARTVPPQPMIATPVVNVR